MPGHMDWDKLRIFHSAAEAGSFTHAGETLNLSQSAVSRQISALEEALAVPLFHRHARGLILTEQGELLYRTAHEVFMKLESARAKLTDSRERPNGDLKVTTTVGLGTHWLTPTKRSSGPLATSRRDHSQAPARPTTSVASATRSSSEPEGAARTRSHRSTSTASRPTQTSSAVRPAPSRPARS